MAIKAITTDSFRDDVLKTRKPVLVKFWAPWCGYCRALAPALESIEKQYESLISVGRVNFVRKQLWRADITFISCRLCCCLSTEPWLDS